MATWLRNRINNIEENERIHENFVNRMEKGHYEEAAEEDEDEQESLVRHNVDEDRIEENFYGANKSDKHNSQVKRNEQEKEYISDEPYDKYHRAGTKQYYDHKRHLSETNNEFHNSAETGHKVNNSHLSKHNSQMNENSQIRQNTSKREQYSRVQDVKRAKDSFQRNSPEINEEQYNFDYSGGKQQNKQEDRYSPFRDSEYKNSNEFRDNRGKSRAQEIEKSFRMIEEENDTINKRLYSIKRAKVMPNFKETERFEEKSTFKSDLIIMSEENQRMEELLRHLEDELSKQRTRKSLYN